MAKQNYIKGKEYKYTYNKYGKSYKVKFSYSGKDCQGYYCTNCGKELAIGYCFIVGDIDNPKEQDFFGSECVKHCISEIVE